MRVRRKKYRILLFIVWFLFRGKSMILDVMLKIDFGSERVEVR